MGNTLLEIVPTFDSSKAVKGNCRKIKSEYYEKNRQCFMMPNGKWNRIDNGKITFDHRDKSWKFIGTPELQEGIVGHNNGEIQLGHFTTKNSDPVVYKKGIPYKLISKSLINELNLIEDIGTGELLNRADFQNVSPDKNYVGEKKIYPYKTTLEYDSKNNLNKFLKKYKELNKEPKKLEFYSNELEDITYGIEYETWNGTIPSYRVGELGVIPLKDGSLRHDTGELSYEYATLPFEGATGLYQVKEICEALTRYTEINTKCSMHLHIGGYNLSKEMVVSVFLTVKAIQEELYSLFPKFYKDTSLFKSKGYCKPFPNINIRKEDDINSIFNRVYFWLSDGREFYKFDNNEHPSNPEGDSKWHINSRYYIVNLVPFIWGNSRTIEFRIHPPTTNAIKSINWIFLCNGILKYANLNKKNWKSIKKSLSLHEVFDSVYSPKLTVYLDNYINCLKSKRKTYDNVEDYIGNIWCKEDVNFKLSDAPF
jgi:hypothetical protein